ncbi:MAG TPA: hypothetical protein VMD91_02740 [Candidatus Sulfotelmatobacter sp.]|nr:hypothetical protein [Candidatus Sulfotelmatobacter sp.]
MATAALAVGPEPEPLPVRIERLDLQINNLELKIQSTPALPAAAPLQREVQSLQSSARAVEAQAAQDPAAAARSVDDLQHRADDDESNLDQTPAPTTAPTPGGQSVPLAPPTTVPEPPTLGYDTGDFPNYPPCTGAPSDSTEASASASEATRPALRVGDVAETLAMTGIGTISELPGVDELTLIYNMADVARETAAYGVDAASDDLTAHLLVMRKESADLQRFFAAERRYPKGSPEYERYRAQYRDAIRAHLVQENAALPKGETWQFMRAAVTSSPEIVMHERTMLAQGVAENLVGLALPFIPGEKYVNPEEILPEDLKAARSVKDALSRHAWREFDGLDAAQKFVAELLEDKITKYAVSWVFNRDGTPVELHQYLHGACVDSSVVAYERAPWESAPIHSVVYAPEVVRNAPSVQVVQVAPVAAGAPLAVAAPVAVAAAPVATAAAASTPAVTETAAPGTTSSTPVQQSRVLGDRWGASSERHSPTCASSPTCGVLIQLSSHPTIAGRVFDGRGL